MASKHGCHNTREYFSWQNMKSRCNNPRNPQYHDYGGRGINFCEQWNEFAAFLADMGPRPEGTTLDREDNDGNYEPGNCRWATRKQQRRNMRTTKMVTLGGVTKPFADWCDERGISREKVRGRVRSGWSYEDALSTRERRWNPTRKPAPKGAGDPGNWKPKLSSLP